MLTKQGFAVGYAHDNLKIFPVDQQKHPIVDVQQGLRHGVKDATDDPKRIAAIWHKHPDASIAWAIPKDMIVIDLDVEKEDHVPLRDETGELIQTGIQSFQNLISQLKDIEGAYKTKITLTQSGGMQFYFSMPVGETSLNMTNVLPKVDIKGFGGYVILPGSDGEYGSYRSAMNWSIKEIPQNLWKWLKEKAPSSHNGIMLPSNMRIPQGKIQKSYEAFLPLWVKADGMRWNIGKAFFGMLYRNHWSEADAVTLNHKLCEKIPNGREHKDIAKWVYAKMQEGYTIPGETVFKKLASQV